MDLYNYKATVTNVVDGDTVDVTIDVGFSLYSKHRLRLLGINTPELTSHDVAIKEAAQKAKLYVKERLLNKEVVIHTEKGDAFGRYLATIYLEGVNINQEILDKGLAVIFV